MSDLTSGRDLVYFGPNRERVSMTLLSGQKVYQGGFAAVKINGSNAGKVVGVGSDINNADGYSRIVGLFNADYDASSTGANADLTCLVRPMRSFAGVWVPNSTSAAVTAAYVGRKVYAEDNNKATITVSNNAVLGVCWAVSTLEGVLIEPIYPTGA